MKVDREELLERFKTEDVYTVAESMGITPLQLAVVCKQEKVPWPGAHGSSTHRKLTSDQENTGVSASDPEPIPLPAEEDRQRGRFAVNRSTLYSLVWQHPIVKLATAWGISDVGLSKTCKRHKIPRPGLGYWQRKEAGHACQRTRLPQPQNEYTIEILCSDRTLGPKPTDGAFRASVYRQKYKHLDHEQARLAQELYDREAAAPPISVGDELIDPHPLVAKTLKAAKRAKTDQRKLVRPEGKGVLTLYVAPASVDRSCRIFDALIKALEERDLKLWVDTSEVQVSDGWHAYDGYHPPVTRVENHTFVEVLGERMELWIFEKSAQSVVEPAVEKKSIWDRREYVYTPTGDLTLDIKISGTRPPVRHGWSDGKTRKLESCLNSFMKGLVDAAVGIRADRLRWDDFNRRWEAEKRQREEQERLEQEEQARLEQLAQDVKAWKSAHNIRDFAGAVRAAAEQRGLGTERGTELGDWLCWAMEVATMQDPLSGRLPGYQKYGLEPEEADEEI